MQFDDQLLIKTIAKGDPYKEDIIYGTPLISSTEPIITWKGLIWKDISNENEPLLKIYLNGWQILTTDLIVKNDLNSEEFISNEVLSAHQGYVLKNNLKTYIYDSIMYSTKWILDETSNLYTYTFTEEDTETDVISLESIQLLYPGKNITLNELKVLQSLNILEDSQGDNWFKIKALSGSPDIDLPVRILIKKNL